MFGFGSKSSQILRGLKYYCKLFAQNCTVCVSNFGYEIVSSGWFVVYTLFSFVYF